MSASQSIHDTAQPEHEEALEGLPPGFGDGLSGKIAFWIAFIGSSGSPPAGPPLWLLSPMPGNPLPFAGASLALSTRHSISA